jgi:hypothetical protein
VLFYSHVRTSWHLIIKRGETIKYPQYFTSISTKNLNFIFIIQNQPVVSNFEKITKYRFNSVFIWLSNLLTLSVPVEGYSRNTWCTLTLISTFLLTSVDGYQIITLHCSLCTILRILISFTSKHFFHIKNANHWLVNYIVGCHTEMKIGEFFFFKYACTFYNM